ncbi:Hypothetical predicted protein [Olea europaea subsp. europaea]|uniref:Uncharacterized protein n=1 Tax=Olea europaea subsp. europaea TaxID=158383 RepID=A0A8S0RZT6_OLEEU|nr:Hypothetical predicted protein [Olea europaea subsp. europaea]
MSQKAGGRHQRQPSRSVFVFPDNFSSPLTEDNDGGDSKLPPLAAGPPPKEKTGGAGGSLPPTLPPKSLGGMPAPDHSGKDKA